MTKSKKVKVQLNEESQAILNNVATELHSRNAKDYNVCSVIDGLLGSPAGRKALDEFVDANTPEEYKIAKLLDDPRERERIRSILAEKSFGIGDKELLNPPLRGSETPVHQDATS